MTHRVLPLSKAFFRNIFPNKNTCKFTILFDVIVVITMFNYDTKSS